LGVELGYPPFRGLAASCRSFLKRSALLETKS